MGVGVGMPGNATCWQCTMHDASVVHGGLPRRWKREEGGKLVVGDTTTRRRTIVQLVREPTGCTAACTSTTHRDAAQSWIPIGYKVGIASVVRVITIPWPTNRSVITTTTTSPATTALPFFQLPPFP
jgi:hypothetical protein